MRSTPLLLTPILLLACAGANAPPTEPAGPPLSGPGTTAPLDGSAKAPETAASGDTASPEPSDPRQERLAFINKYAYGDGVADRHQRARIVAAGLSEEDFGLHPSEVKGLAAVVSPKVDPSQCGMILRETVREGAMEATTARCGDFAALVKLVSALPFPERAAAVVKQCKLELPSDVELSRVDPWALLLSQALLEQLGGPQSQEAPRIALGLLYICDPEAQP